MPIPFLIKDCFKPLCSPTFFYTDPAKNPLEKFKDRVLKELSSCIAQQNHQKTYARSQFTETSPHDLNPPSIVNIIPAGIEYASSNVKFFPFNAEGLHDYGWGCAWRAIQTCLASGGIDSSFETLFHLFGPEQNLKFLYSDKNDGWELFNDKPFAPYDLSKGWAEPFVGQMAFHFFNRTADLESINHVPKSCNAPREVFHNTPLSYQSFVNRLIAHFNRNDPLPVMLDNGAYAFCILGVGSNGKNTTLWVADPHIKPGAAQVKEIKGICGVYTLSFDEIGKQIECSLDHADCDQIDLMSSSKYKVIEFNQMDWMALFPL